MPFKSLASLKKIANLNAEVVALAPLEGDKLIGVLTNDPAQVSVIPYATGTTKSKNISLDDVTNLALITKHAAVVKTGAELWGVLDIQHFCHHDGPGIRTTVFLKGCSLRCKWCCNPESIADAPELAYDARKCIGEAQCGRCLDACPEKAIRSSPTDGKVEVDWNRCTDCGNSS